MCQLSERTATRDFYEFTWLLAMNCKHVRLATSNNINERVGLGVTQNYKKLNRLNKYIVRHSFPIISSTSKNLLLKFYIQVLSTPYQIIISTATFGMVRPAPLSIIILIIFWKIVPTLKRYVNWIYCFHSTGFIDHDNCNGTNDLQK